MIEKIPKGKIVKCPNCQKRVFDLKKAADGCMELQLKCPHCKNIVNISVDKYI